MKALARTLLACTALVVGIAGAASAQAAAPHGLPRGAKEDAAKRTSFSSTYSLPNGSKATVVSAGRVNFRDAHGHWQRIQNRFVRGAAGTLVSGPGPLGVTIPNDADQRLRVAAGADSLTMQLLGAHAPVEMDGPHALFAGAMRGVNVAYAMNAGTLKETLDVHGDAVPTVFRFAVALSHGLSLVDRGAEGIVVTDSRGKASFAIPPAVMWDQSTGPRELQPVPMSIERSHGRQLVVLRPNAAWLRQHAAAGDVTIDPTITLQLDTSQTVPMLDLPMCQIDSSHPTTATFSCQTGGAFGWSGDLEFRQLLRFDVSSLHGVRITSATLDGDLLEANPAGHYVAQEIARPWNRCVGWNDATMGGAEDLDCVVDETFWAVPGGDTTGHGAPFSANAVGSNGVMADVTGIIQDWINHPSANQGMLIRASDHSNLSEFSIGEDESFSLPSLIVTYAPELGKADGHEMLTHALTDRLSLALDTSTGNVLLQGDDVKVQSRGLPFAVTRTYGSMSAHVGMFGRGMTSNIGLDQRIVQVNSSLPPADPSAAVTLIDDSGRDLYFVPGTLTNGATPYTTVTADYSGHLTHNADGTWSLVERDGTARSFDSGGFLTLVTDKDGNATRITYGSSPKRPTKLTDSQGRDYTLGYSGDGLISSIADEAGRTWGYTYATDGSKRMLTSTDPAGGVTTYGWTSATGQINRVVTPAGRITKLTYGSDGRVTSITRVTNRSTEAGDTVTVSSNATCNATLGCIGGLGSIVTDERGHRWGYQTDQNYLLSSLAPPAGPVELRGYDAAAQLSGRSVGTAHWTTTYDPNDLFHVTSTTDPVGVKSTETYDPSHPDQVASTTDELGTKLTYSYADASGTPAAGRLSTASVTGLGAVYQYAYNSFGELQHVTTGAGNPVVDYGYDNAGQLTSVTRPNPRGNETMSYDALSRLQVDTDASLRSRTIGYDKLDRQTLISYSDGSSIAYEYDADGNKTKRTVTPASGAAQVTTWSYDDKDRLTDQTLPGNVTTHYTYDATDNLTSVADAGGTVSYGYDDANRLTSITEPPVGGQAQVTTIGYDANGNRSTITTPNGRTVTYTSNAAGRQTAMTLAPTAGGSALISRTYNYTNPDPNAPQATTTKVFSETNESGQTTSYSYSDPLHRLTDATTVDGTNATIASYGYAYDPFGDITRMTKNGANTFFGVNGASLLTGIGPVQGSPSTTFSSDASGFLKSSSAGLALQYDALGQTTSIQPDAGSSATALAYADSDQTEPIQEGSDTLAEDKLGIAERTSSGGQTFYTRTPDGDLIGERTPSGRFYFATDRQDSVLGLTDSTGAIARKLRYDPYGSTILDTGAGPTAFGYAGGENLPGGFVRFGKRLYDPALGRWTQPDPLDQSSDVRQADPYSYAGDDPVNLTDQNGQIAGYYVGVCRANPKSKACKQYSKGPAIPPRAAKCAAVGAIAVVGIIATDGAAALTLRKLGGTLATGCASGLVG